MYQGPYGNQQGQYPGQYQGAAPPGGAGPPPPAAGGYAQPPPPQQPSYQQQQGQYGGGAYAPAPQQQSYPSGGGGGGGGAYPAGQQAPRQQGYGQPPSGYGGGTGGNAYSSYAGAAPAAAAQPPPPPAPYPAQQQQQYGGQGAGGYGGGQGQGPAYGGYAGGGGAGQPPPAAAYGSGSNAQGAYGAQQAAAPPPQQQQYYPPQQQQYGGGAGGAPQPPPPAAAAAAAPAYAGGGQYSGYPSQQQAKQPTGDFQAPSQGWQQRERDRQGPGGYGRSRDPRGPPGGPPTSRSGPSGAPPPRRRHESDHYGAAGPKQQKQQRGKAGPPSSRGGGKGGQRGHHGDRDHHHNDRHHHSSRRRSPSPAHDAPPTASVHLPAYQLGATPSMDYLEVSRRFDRMVMPEDFVCAVRRQVSGDPSAAADPAASGVAPGLGLSRTLDLSHALPMHHEVLAAKVDAGPLVAYDPAVPAASAVAPDAVLPGAAPADAAAAAAAAADPPVPGSTVYNAKVVLLSGLGETERAAAAVGPGRSGGDHVSRLIKFVVARAERSGAKTGIFALGGRCLPTLDGDPEGADGDAALIRAATRHVAAQTGLDLRLCTRWHRALEIRYFRPVAAVQTGDGSGGGKGDGGDGAVGSGNSVEGEVGYHEVTVLFVVDDAHAAVPAIEAWDAAWAGRHTPRAVPPAPEPPAPEPPAAGEEEDGPEDGELPEPEPVPAAPSQEKGKKAPPPQPPAPALLCIGLQNTVLRLKTMSISLDGLLDYNESDTDEATFELSMLGEALHEVMSRDAGGTMLRALRQRPWAVAARAVAGHKRKAAAVTENEEGGGGGGEGKRSKTEGGEEAEAEAPEFIKMEVEGGKEIKEEEEEEEGAGEEGGDAAEEAAAPEAPDAVKEEPAVAEGEPEVDVNAAGSPPEGGEGEAAAVVVPPAVSALLTEFELACGYFDAAGAGYITTDDVQVIVESLGAELHHGAARRLAQRAAAFAGKPVRCDYRRLCRHR